MNLLEAIRIDHDRFSLPPVEVPGTSTRLWPLFFLAFFRWTSYACPHCERVFRRDYWPHNVRLGNPERICRKCGKPFDDGSREWPELGLAKKIRFFLPPGILAFGGSLIFCAIFFFLLTQKDMINWQDRAIVVCIFLSPILAWCLVRLLWVLPSKDRFENDPYALQRKLETGGSH